MSLTTYLRKYMQIQENIVLVYRPTLKNGWSNRCLFLDDNYDGHTPYNHRSILEPEVIFEFDTESPQLNKELINVVSSRLSQDGFSWNKWTSGNKSIHLHTMVDTKNAKSIPLLKKCLLRYYTSGLEVLPDLRLAARNHLIRAEYGVHEKTGKQKKFISGRGKYPELNNISETVWHMYVREQEINSKRKLTTDLSELEAHKGFKYIINSEEFRASDDGRERALFMLIHILKPKYKDKRDELIAFLQDWYRYSSGTKLTEKQIAHKVYYHWNKTYNITNRYINELLESIGRNDLCQ